MDCKEFKGLIQDFIHDGLDENSLSEFLAHTEECSDCMDELRTQYLIYEGLERMESGESFDLDKDLDKLMETESSRLRVRRGVQRTAIGAEIITTAAFLIVLCLILVYQ